MDDTALQMDLESVRDGAELLVSMNEARLLQCLLDRLPSWHPSIVMKSAIQSTLDGLILSYPELLQNLSETDYLPLSDDIFQNSAQVPELAFFADAQGRVEPLLRDGLRWELFGLIFTFAGLSLINLSEDDPLLATQTAGLKTKSVLLQDLVRSSNTCIQFQEGLGSTSDLLVWLLYENLVLLVAYHGGISHHIWQRLGSLSTAIFASSLHQHKREADASPLLIQFRQRLFAASYGLDKDIATLFSRPPMIPRQFCIWELPFDLDGSSYDRNIGGGLEAKDLSISLWNRVGIVDEASLDRIKLLMSPFREELLQLMLRPATPLTVDHQDLSQRIHKTWMALPTNFRYSPDCWQSGRSPYECYILLTGHLEYMHTQFLFQRYITCSDPAQLEGLVNISRQILSTLLKAATQRERFIELRSDFAWRITQYGLPTVGVIAGALLIQAKNRNSQRANWIQSFPQARVVQELSMFLSCLDWAIRPNDGAGNIICCQQARKCVERIVEYISAPHDMQSPFHVQDFGFIGLYMDEFLRQASKTY